MAANLIESMTTPWDPENYRDTYTERVEQIVEAKKNNEEVITQSQVEPTGKVVDLMEALQASLDNAKDATDEVADMSRSELYDVAQDLDIPGRSKMNRKELAEAETRVRRATPWGRSHRPGQAIVSATASDCVAVGIANSVPGSASRYLRPPARQCGSCVSGPTKGRRRTAPDADGRVRG